MNRLAQEKSPYLLQHAENPVDWFSWGEEAFQAAREADKPIFLSIGYATCHWCHVMAHESFESPEIAAAMNDTFICIKVDREERPDIDAIYMMTCQMMTGQGGWPLSIVMTPEKQPFYAATYIPPENRYGRMGMDKLIPALKNAWKHQKTEVMNSAHDIYNTLVQQQVSRDESGLQPELVGKGYRELMGQYDKKNGGFGSAPKFPTPHRLILLLRQGETDAMSAARHTLHQMRLGGIFDHIGFGFHRYSTDPHWLLPHFEKMLYDQALLACAYLEAFEYTQEESFADVAREILLYVSRDMTDPLGGFYSAEDADSEGEEGLFYIWSASELKQLLGDKYSRVGELWNISEAGNFKDESSGEASPFNIPHLSRKPNNQDRDLLLEAGQTLFEVRENRIHPQKDTKVLADWNGLMIAAFARAARVLDDEFYLDLAKKANQFIQSQMTTEEGELWHRWCDGEVSVPGQMDDYVFLTQGLLELYESTLDLDYLDQALRYNDILKDNFIDAAGGGYFMTSIHAEELITRPKSLYDGATPSGNSLHMLNLLKLSRLTGKIELEQQAGAIEGAYTDALKRSPSNISQALIALQFAQGDTQEVVIVGPRHHSQTQEMLTLIQAEYDPFRVILLKDPEEQEHVSRVAPFTADMDMLDEKPTVYICQNFACDRPINSPDALQKKLHPEP
ncbi:MAG: thioredoxin domain-containing protein [Candidatus Marinimicrobia bacterium]|nr:thioredoxin domain-containing protein [Candidatus Neomarinimicrobiota bacterium]MCF7850273.1 thioredoxin domain-containing protein [Candidatus Neomarinimicrobiota bacterium]MCF7903830.1 thioredoxin domain-containing protein [Candidatus Neomarinimicrobiota bacterium]